MDFEDESGSVYDPDTTMTSPELKGLRVAIERRLAIGETDALPMDDAKRVLTAITSYDEAYQSEFCLQSDHCKLVGQDNFRRYLPVEALRVRVHPDDTPFEIFARTCAAKAVGCRITVSSPPELDSPAVQLLDEFTDIWAASIEFVEESDDELANLIAESQTDRVRYAAIDRAPQCVLRAVGDSDVHVARSPVLVCGRIELLWYLREQSISHDYHRYGNLGERGAEERRPVD